MSFGKQTVDTTSADKDITVTNNNTNVPGGAVTISSITPSNSAFSIDRSNTTCSSSLPAGGGNTCTIAVKFSPTAASAISATLNIVDNAGNGTQKAGLHGVGE